MSSRLKVDLILQDHHWPAFRSFVARPSTTVDALHQWLAARGYKVSRNAAWNALRFHLRTIERFNSDADARRQARACLNRLKGDPLQAIAFLIVFTTIRAARVPVGRKSGKFRRPV
jgi:hypothetical protein